MNGVSRGLGTLKEQTNGLRRALYSAGPRPPQPGRGQTRCAVSSGLDALWLSPGLSYLTGHCLLFILSVSVPSRVHYNPLKQEPFKIQALISGAA